MLCQPYQVLKPGLFSKFLRILSGSNFRQKMVNEEIVQRFQRNNARAEELLKFIEKEIPLLQKAAAIKHQEQRAIEVKERNLQLKKELEYWMKRVTELEIMSGIKQFSLPSDNGKGNAPSNESVQSGPKDDGAVSKPPVSKSPAKESVVKKEATQDQPKKEPAAKESKKEKAPKVTKPQPTEEAKDISVSRLDLRIGHILNAKKHPDAESLYVEEIDVGEAKPRTVVSGLVKFVPLEEMQNRMVVVLCNLKPAKMRGVLSEAMVMCASTPEKVEILCPPPDSVPGDRVSCDEYPGEPEALLPPKKKIFEQVAPDLKTDGNCNATYKSAFLKVAGKGVVKSASLINVQIK